MLHSFLLINPVEAITNWCLNSAAVLIDHSIGVDQLNDVANTVGMTADTGYDYSVLWSVVNDAIAVVKPFGLVLLTTYFLMYLFDVASKDQITVDSLIKVLIQLVIVVALIGNLDAVINALLSMGESIFSLITDAITNDPEGNELTGEAIVDAWYENANDTPATILFQSLILWCIHQIAIIAVYFAIFSRMIELAWRIIFAPIGIANNFEGGANSAGIRYLKSIAGLALAGAAVFVVCAAGFAISATMLSSENAANGDNTTLLGAMAALLATAGAAIGISGKIKDVFN